MSSRIQGFLRRNVVVLAALVLAVVYALVSARLRLSHEVGAYVYGPLSLVVAAVWMRRLRFDRGTRVILLGGLVLYFLYLGYTSPGERNYDGPEQLDKYIGYIVANHKLPLAANKPPDGCFICHHPPLYYVLGALVQSAMEITRVAPKPVNVQVFSLAIFFGFLMYGVLLARLFSERARTVRVTAALLVFWPYSIHNSIRVHNDTLVTALAAGGMYHAARWYKEGRPRDLYAAGAFAALSALTKSSGYAVAACIGLMLAWRFFVRSGRARLLRRGVVTMAMVAAAYGGLKLRAPAADDDCHRRFGTACDIRKSDHTTNRPFNYVFIDVPKLLRDPYMVIHGDESGKQFFWNHLIKSTLFGTHNKVPDRETAYSLNRKLGFVMNVALFGMLVYALLCGIVGLVGSLRRLPRRLASALLFVTFPLGWIVSWARGRPREDLLRKGAALPLLFTVIPTAFLMGFKIAIPAPHHNDFRHIYFAIAPAALLFAIGVTRMRDRSAALGVIGAALYVPFLTLSIVYFLPKYDLVMAYTRETIELPLAKVQRIVPEWAPWDRDGNTLIEGNQTLALVVDPPRKVTSIDTTLDGNDVYEIRVIGEGAPRVIVVRPKKGYKPGLGRYTIDVSPPVEDAQRITVRPVNGDRTYSLGHLVVQ